MKTLEESRQFKGVRMRKWGKWISEVRIPNSRAKIWLGSYDTSEKAARAFDAAIYCLRGPIATKFNFPDTVPVIPAASSLSRRQIQIAAAKYARDQIPSTTKNIDDNIFTEDAEILAKSPPLPETGALIDTKQDSEEFDLKFLESLLEDENRFFSSDNFPSLDASTATAEVQRSIELLQVAQISSQKTCTGRCRCTPSSLE